MPSLMGQSRIRSCGVLVFTSIVLFLLMSCVDYRSKQTTATNSLPVQPAVQRNPGGEAFDITSTKGVVVLNKFNKGDWVRFYNGEGTVWYEFSFFYDDSDGKFDFPNNDFRPFAFHQDHFLLVLRCTATSDQLLQVVVNEETGLKKYVKANDPVLKLETWEEFVVKVFSVNFDKQANPILATPNGEVKSTSIPSDANFRPVETEGEWLKIRWDVGDRTAKPKPDASGWIRWKKAGVLQIDFSYFA